MLLECEVDDVREIWRLWRVCKNKNSTILLLILLCTSESLTTTMKFAIPIAALFTASTGAFAPCRVPAPSAGPLFGANPPPFSDWGQSAVPTPTPPAGIGNPPPFSDWGQPASPIPAPASGNPPPFSDWGQPASPAADLGQPSTPVSAEQPPGPAPEAPFFAPAVVSGGNPIATLNDLQISSVNAIAAAIPDLAPKPDLSWSGETVGGESATLDARDAPGPANVAWLASVCIPSKLSSLTIFNGPLTDVPHLLSRCCLVNDNTLRLDLDFRPRAYGAYELKDANGNYPGPEELGRKAFEYSGARNDFDEKFGTTDVVAFLNDAMASFEGATVNESTELERLTGGPLALSFAMPLTDGNLAAVAAVREQAAATWLRWALEDDHEHRPGAPVNTQYVYDAKFRQNAYSALLPLYSSILGADDGAKLAAAESGPLDEAYVGGGS